MNREETLTLVKLKYPNPDADFIAFINSMPDEVVHQYYNETFKDMNASIKRLALVSFYNLNSARRALLYERLYEYLADYEESRPDLP